MIAPALIPFVVIALLCYQALEAEGCHLSCDFDKNLCDYEQSTDDNADWTRIQGETPSSGTGPSSDHTSGDGWYMYFEASGLRKEGDFADLQGPVVETNSSSEECVTFYYHMRGTSMGSLKVFTYKTQPWFPSYKEIWKIEGQQSKNGTDWKRAKISIKETDPYQLVFRATRGSQYLSDIGLDDIGMSHKACEIPCPGLPQIRNGRVVISASQPYEVGTEVVWTCNSGYILRGHREANCLESGHWSAESPSCEAITCPKMPQIRNGRVEVEGLPPYAVGSGASFTCDEGYVTTGPSLLICLESGKWSGTPTSCSAPTCLRDTSKLEPGRRCRGRCQGNGPSGQCGVLPNVCRCDGWCGMSCLNPNRKCPVLSNPEHGSVTFKGRKYGQIARYKCDPGFSLVGSSERSCRSDRKWSGVAPLCFPYGACGLTEETKVVRKIIRGSNARQGAWPWHVLVSHNRGKGLVQDIIGGGSLIGEKWVLSAAINFDVDFRDQILSKQWKGSFLIVLGMTKSWKNDQELPDYVQIYEPAMVYLHPEFSIINFDFDVALIRIGPKMMQLSNGSYGVDESSSGGKVTFSRFVRPVCLPCVKESITSPSDAWKNFDAQLCSRKGVSSIFPVGSDAVITGFGITKWDDLHSRPGGLQEGHVQVNDDEKCTKYVETLQRDHASEFARYTDQMLCAAGGTGSTRIDSCHGDGGGPLVKKQVQIHEGRKIEYWIQIGISSWGYRKCGTEIPGFYTSVPAVMKWIWKTWDANNDRCKRDLSKLETERKCPAPCQRDDQCTGRAECLCDGSCGMSCVDQNAKCPQLGELENGSIIIPGRTYGSEVTYRCDSGFTVIGPWTRTCRSDRKWSGIAPSCVLLSACGQSGGAGDVKKIVRGSDAKRGAWPWQAILSRNRPGSLVKNIAGAGSLINEEWVLSAAHVITIEFPFALETGNWTGIFIIALGLTNHWRSELPETVQLFEPKSVHVHPQFNRDNHDFDVVLIRIGRNMRRLEDGGFAVVENSPGGKVIYSHVVRPVCLPCVTGVLSKRVDVWMNFDADLCMDKGKYIMSAIAPPGSEAIITGFGYTNYSNPTTPEVLQEGRIKIFSDLECAKDVEEVKSVFPTANYTDQMLCGSGGTESAKVDSCLGDAGGPLVRKQVELRRGKTIESWVQVGIVSWGLRCAELHGFYTSVPSVMKWIWQTLDHVRNEGTPCASRPCHSKAFCTTKNKHQFICTCKSGYTGDGKFCRKILPCDSSPCHPNATCFDDGESRFVCECNEGYQGDGKVCKNQCGPNQYYTKCGTLCPPNCGRQNSEGCRRGCNSDQRCFCKQGYVERSETDKTCIPVDSCPQCFKELPEPRNSYVRCSNERKVGSVCSWFCLSGFKVQGTSKSVCRRDRTWSVLVPPICVPDKSTRDSISKCPVLVVPENSLMECTDGNYPNSKCTFTCLSHYILRGSSERVCSGSNSKWTGTLTFCEEISCTEIEERNGLTKVCYYDGEAVVGSVCIFSCTEDKKFVGSRILTCLAEGIWSRRIPRCTIPDCSIEPALFPNVIKECAPIPSRKTGKVCVFSCEEGYELSGPTRSYCYSGNIWTNTSPTCRRVTCRPSVKDPRNGFARCSNINFYESQCSFVCNEGFILQGAGRVTCGKQGRWSDRFPTCQMIKCPPIRNFNGLYSCSDGQNVGSICRLSCQPGSGFPELSATRLECVKKSESALEAGRANAYLGRWDNPIPRCVAIKCPRLGPTSQHATRRCLPLGYNVGTICTFRCDAGYRMSGAARTVCNAKSDGTAEGEWSKPQPSCQRSMPCDLKPCHINANCWNGEIAGYLCQCKKGYTGDGKLCKKILPCDSNPCDQNADCKNQRRNRFTCKCRNGYTGDGDTCTKILPCGSNPCDQNADCKNERGNRFTCKCRNGYKGDGTSCEKIMPCDSKPCDQNADCKNERGNRFSCKCRDGYKGDGETCEKILPCDSNPCDPNADCKNERGNRFTCKCKNGYKGDGTSCEKIMPCDSKPCDQNADCKNERGNRFTCKCKNGYKGDGTSCEKIMPCEMKPCDQNADCKNELGNRFTCKCRNGYRGDGSTCTKILPCDSNPCDVNAECKNERRNRFSCKCRKGYKRDGETCAKILPCDSNPCDQNADCRNELAGRFSCKCRDGFRGDGETCKQILPCDANPCERNAECKNERNNRYSCKCKGGYEGDGKTCTSTEKIHCPNIDDIRHGNYRTSSEAPYAVGAVANFDCDVGFKANGKFRLTCLIGGRWSAPIPYCIANVCKRDLRRIEQGRKCRKPCKQDSQCKGAFKRCQCDDWCGRSCFNPNADCVLPTQPRNGYIIENGRSYGQTVTYGCDEGFTLNGPSTRICRSDRAWSGHTPICLPYSACGQSVEVRGSSSFGKVRGGSNAKQGAWPWQALLIRHLKRTVEKILDMQDVFGGGSVINDEWILSAAHVFDDLFYLSTESNNWDNTFLIILGMTNYPNPKPGHGIPDHFQIFQPQDVHLHPKFNPQSFDYDIALIRVGKRVTSDGKTSFQVGGVHESRKITFTRYVRPVCLPCMKEDPAKLLDVLEGYSKKICPREGAFTISTSMKNTIMVTGFGMTAHNGSFLPTTLQQGTLKIRDKVTCSESLNDIRYYNEHARYTERMFCASSANDSLKVDACQGDSGGPVVVKMKSDQKVEYWRQIGIVSWGFKCADKHPGFYTSLYSFMDWIWKILDDEKKAVVCGEKFFRDDSHYNVTSCPAGMTVGSKCSLKCENGYKWTLEESVWNAKCTLKGSSDSIAEWDFHNAPICEI